MNQIKEAKFSLADAAEFLNVSPATVRREIKRGNLGSYRMAARRLLGERHLRKYLTQREQKPSSTD